MSDIKLEDLRKWFGKGKKGDWIRVGTDGEIKGDCAREPGEGKPKCMPRAKAHSMSKKDRASAARRKRKADPVTDRPGTGNKPIMVKTDKKEGLEEKNVPTNPKLWTKFKAQAKTKFDVYPSAYANGWAAKQYKAAGGGWKTESVQEMKSFSDMREAKSAAQQAAIAIAKKEKGEKPLNEKDPCWDGYKQVGTKKGRKGNQVPNCVPEETQIDEKSVSKAQQRFMGMVRAKQKGEMPDASPEVSKAAASMSKKDVKDFAKTKHKGLPAKKESVELGEAKISVGDRVTLKPNKSVLDRSFIGKAGVVTNMLDGEAMVKFANGRTIAVSPSHLKINEASMKFFEFREALREAKGSNYEVYHKDFSSAVQYAKKEVEKKGYEIDDDEWFRKVASGPRKPSKGKTNSYNIELMKNGKPVKQRLQMQVYGMDSGKYELNMYVS